MEGPVPLPEPGSALDEERGVAPGGIPPGGFAGARVIARINDEPVTREDLDLEIDHLMRRVFGDQVPPEQRQQFRTRLEASAFRQLVLRSQLRAYSEENGLTVDDAQIDEKVKEVLSRFGSEEQAEAVLSRAGMTKEELRQDVARGALMEKAVDHYLSKLPKPSTAEIEAYYQEHVADFTQPEHVVARHILIQAAPEEDAASKEAKLSRAEEIRKELLEGADFAEAARKYSEGPSSVNGGLLNPFSRGDMAPEFEKAAFELDPGAISEIVETQFGFHIIQVSSHEAEKVMGLDEARPDVLKQMEAEVLGQWFQQLADAAKVEPL